jgi:hypothetical protein
VKERKKKKKNKREGKIVWKREEEREKRKIVKDINSESHSQLEVPQTILQP